MLDGTIVIKRYWGGESLYWTGIGWSNVAARARRFDSHAAAHACEAATAPDAQVDGIVAGRNLARVFNLAR